LTEAVYCQAGVMRRKVEINEYDNSIHKYDDSNSYEFLDYILPSLPPAFALDYHKFHVF